MTQPLEEAYHSEILEVHQKMDDMLKEMSDLMKRRIPYDEWPPHCKILGENEDFMGLPQTDKEITSQLSNQSDLSLKELERALLFGWRNCQVNNRPDESFRAMIQIIMKFKGYIEEKYKLKESANDIWDVLKESGLNPMKTFPIAMLSKIESIGRAQEKLKTILEFDIFGKSAFDPYWTDDYPEFDKRLDELREKISQIDENLQDLAEILHNEDR